MNKPVFLGLSILDLSKIVMYEFWYHYVKTDDICKDVAENVETKFDTSNFEIDKHYVKEKMKN